VRGGKIFATLAYPDTKWGMVKLTPEQHEEFVRAEPEVFEPVRRAVGDAAGATSVRLAKAKKEILKRRWRRLGAMRLRRSWEGV